MLPLAIGDATVGGGGGDGPAYYPMARAIMGGLAFSAVISLLIVPMFYVWFDELNTWRRRVFARPAALTAPEGAIAGAARGRDRPGRTDLTALEQPPALRRQRRDLGLDLVCDHLPARPRRARSERGVPLPARFAAALRLLSPAPAAAALFRAASTPGSPPRASMMFGAAYVFVYYAEQHVVSGLVAVGYSASPLIGMFGQRLFFGTPITARIAAGSLLGIAGIGLVFAPEFGSFRAGERPALGAAFTMASVLFSMLGSLVAHRNHDARDSVLAVDGLGHALRRAVRGGLDRGGRQVLRIRGHARVRAVAALPGRVRLDPGLRGLPDPARPHRRRARGLCRRHGADRRACWCRLCSRASTGRRSTVVGIAISLVGNVLVLRKP